MQVLSWCLFDTEINCQSSVIMWIKNAWCFTGSEQCWNYGAVNRKQICECWLQPLRASACCYKLLPLAATMPCLSYHCTNIFIVRQVLGSDNLQTTWNPSLAFAETTAHQRHEPFVDTSLSLHRANSQLAIMERDYEDVCVCLLFVDEVAASYLYRWDICWGIVSLEKDQPSTSPAPFQPDHIGI